MNTMVPIIFPNFLLDILSKHLIKNNNIHELFLQEPSRNWRFPDRNRLSFSSFPCLSLFVSSSSPPQYIPFAKRPVNVKMETNRIFSAAQIEVHPELPSILKGTFTTKAKSNISINKRKARQAEKENLLP